MKSASDCAGTWKAMVYYAEADGTPVSRELMNITITPSFNSASVTLDWYKILYEDELSWRDESGMGTSSWSCLVDSDATASGFYAISGKKLDDALQLGPFWNLGGNMQYGYGAFLLPDGGVGYIALVRP